MGSVDGNEVEALNENLSVEEEPIEERVVDAICEPTETFVHSLPLLSTVDHYTRVSGNSSRRVVGILLGHNVNGKIYCTNSFAVPFEEDTKKSKIWFIDEHFLEDMFTMFKKVNAKEQIVGWYSTGPKLRQNDMDIHQAVRKYCTHPIYIIIRVDEDSVSKGLPCTAYKAVEKIEDESAGPKMTFIHLKSTLRCSAMEEIGVSHLLRDIQDYTVSSLSTQVKEKLSGLEALCVKLTEIQVYMQDVVDGKAPISNSILYNIQDIFNALPSLHLIRQSAHVATEVNDQTMVTYLGSLLRAVVALHNLILNKFEMQQREDEIKAKKLADAQKQKQEEDKRANEKETIDEDAKQQNDQETGEGDRTMKEPKKE